MSNALTHSPADVVRYLLIDLGIGTDPEDEGSWPIFCDGEGDTPDNVITIYNTSGAVQGDVHYNGEVQEHQGLQFRIRGGTSVIAWGKTEALKTKVDQDVNGNVVTIDAVQYEVYCIARTGTVIALGKVDGKRYVYTLNATVSLRQITS